MERARDEAAPHASFIEFPLAMPQSNEQAIQRLAEIQKQQEASSQSIELLKAQHQEWQQSIRALCAEIRQSIDPPNSQAELLQPCGDCASEQIASDLQSVNSGNRPSTGELCVECVIEPVEVPAAAPKQLTTSMTFGRRTGTLDDIFRSRKSVVEPSREPSGLKQMVLEEMTVQDTEAPQTRSEKLMACARKIVDSVYFEQPGRGKGWKYLTYSNISWYQGGNLLSFGGFMCLATFHSKVTVLQHCISIYAFPHVALRCDQTMISCTRPSQRARGFPRIQQSHGRVAEVIWTLRARSHSKSGFCEDYFLFLLFKHCIQMYTVIIQ